MSHQVFISFSSRDQRKAELICARIEESGLRCWVSYRDVEPGENYQEAIVAAIQEASVFVLVFSTNSNDSQEVHKELSLASAFKASVIPVRIADTVPRGALAYELATRQWVDAFSDWEAALDHLVMAAERAAAAPRSDRSFGAFSSPATKAVPSGQAPLAGAVSYGAPTVQAGLDVLAEFQSMIPAAPSRQPTPAPTFSPAPAPVAPMAPPPEAAPQPTPPAAAYAFTRADLDAARIALAMHLGPIADILVRRTAADAKSLADLHARLAAHIKSPVEQAAFRKKLNR